MRTRCQMSESHNKKKKRNKAKERRLKEIRGQKQKNWYRA